MYLEKNRDRIEDIFAQRVEKYPALFAAAVPKIQKEEEEVQLALKYLYGAMPLSDAGNYPFAAFLDYAVQGVVLWDSCVQRGVPEDIYLNYVLNHRVNTEEITPCRSFFYGQLKDRVADRSMKEAVLEANYWCAEQATYQATDDRTVSPMTVYRCGYGRCGEESAFTVSVLRSVGIPARQVYAPRWAHCDDNHAWTEAWCEGEWHFLGACEPEQILDRGWFTNASSRAMLIHSRSYGGIKTGEDLIASRGIVSEYNQLARYAHTREVTVEVLDQEGKPAEDVRVDFEILNYAELFPVASMKTDGSGKVRTALGLGCVHIMAFREGECGRGYARGILDVRRQEKIVLQLTVHRPAGFMPTANKLEDSMPTANKLEDSMPTANKPADPMPEACKPADLAPAASNLAASWEDFDIIAPEDAPINTDKPDETQKAEGDRRFREAKEKREAKAAGRKQGKLELFLGKEDQYTGLRKAIADVLTVKDRNDEKTDIWEEHVRCAAPYAGQYPREVFVPWVLDPRVEFEVLGTYRKAVMDCVGERENQFREFPQQIWEFIQREVKEEPEGEYDALTTSPAACLEGKTGSRRSKEILFVAMARTLGIPARLNPVDGEMEYWNQGKFYSVGPLREKTARFVFRSADSTDWTYFTNWSIARLTPSGFVSLHLEQLTWEKGELCLWAEPGVYRILTANRLPNGNLFASQMTVEAAAKETVTIKMKLREADLKDMLEDISIQDFHLRGGKKEPISLSQLTAEGTTILLWLEESKEPTEHILNEMMADQEKFGKYQEQITFILRGEKAKKDPTLSKAMAAFPRIAVCFDDFQEHVEPLARRMYVDPEKLPLIIVCNGPLNGIYAASGYNVGTGEMLLRLLEL